MRLASGRQTIKVIRQTDIHFDVMMSLAVSFFFSLSLSLSLSHTHTHTTAHPQAHNKAAHTNTSIRHTSTPKHTHTDASTHTSAMTQARTHTHFPLLASTSNSLSLLTLDDFFLSHRIAIYPFLIIQLLPFVVYFVSI